MWTFEEGHAIVNLRAFRVVQSDVAKHCVNDRFHAYNGTRINCKRPIVHSLERRDRIMRHMFDREDDPRTIG